MRVKRGFVSVDNQSDHRCPGGRGDLGCDRRNEAVLLDQVDLIKHGLRIDLVLVTAPLASRLVDVGIDYDIRAMDKPSDHCPVWISLDL